VVDRGVAQPVCMCVCVCARACACCMWRRASKGE
jgi:hypothetical protein